MIEKSLRCLVTGATGYIGGRLIPRLLDQGFSVRALVRSPDKLSASSWRENVEVVCGDLTDASSLAAALEDVDVVYYLVHSMGTSHDFVTQERRAAENLVSVARRTKVRRIIYLSGLHPEHDELSAHLASRAAVGEVLLSSGIETIVLQAGVVVGSGSASFEMIRHLTDRLPLMTTPRWVHNKIQPISIGDALIYLAAAATCAVPESRAWDIGGPDVLEYGDMMRVYAEVAGLRSRRILVLPVLTPRIAALWVGLVTPIPSGLARPLVESLHCDAVMHNNDIDTIIPAPAGGLTSYREAVAHALTRLNGLGVEQNRDHFVASTLPSDPQWAGEATRTHIRSRHTSMSPDGLWKAVMANVPQNWSIERCEPGRALILRSEWRGTGERRLEMTVTAEDGGTRYEQRGIYYPRGLMGKVWWVAGGSRWVRSLNAQLSRVISSAD